MSKLLVKVLDTYSGDIVFEKDQYIFNYKMVDTKKNISLTMPVREKSYVHNKLFPIFEMHLPEGYLLSIIKKHFSKLVKTDDFGLLKVMSPSIKGRLTYENNQLENNNTLTIDDLKHPKSDKLFDELVSKFALTSSLSGVQPKVIAQVEDKATLKLDEYIVKSWGEEYSELALNEFYCMQIVRDANIEVPEFFISDDEKLFVMKRFDITDDNVVLGFEDMCVLQAKQRDDKYEGSYEKVVKTIKTFVSSRYTKSSLVQFYKMIIINYLVQNGDAHLKNFGLIYSDLETIKLAPAYDIVCTTAYIENDIPALHLLGSKKWWSKKYLLKFGIESCDFTSKEAEKYYMECQNSLNKNILSIKDRLMMEQDINKKKLLTKLLEKFAKI